MKVVFRKSTLFCLTSALICGLMVAVFAFGLWYVDGTYHRVRKEASYTDIQPQVAWFFEKSVPMEDIPAPYRQGLETATTDHVFRYTFLMYPLAFHVIYNADMTVELVIPSYE